MKIALIHNGLALEGWLWVYHVLSCIKNFNKDIDITVFCRDVNVYPINVINELSEIGVNLKKNNIFFKNNHIYNFLFGGFFKRNLNKKYDLVINTWPYSTESCKLSIPYYFVCHELIFLHYFGHHCSNVYSRNSWKKTSQTLRNYIINGCIPCFSSDFIAKEFINTFHYKKSIKKIIVPGLYLNNINLIDEDCFLKKNNINYEYIILYTGSAHYKNTEEVLSAYYLVKRNYPDLKMIIIGDGVEDVFVKMDSFYYANHVSYCENYDIKSVHISSINDMLILIKHAKLYINMALYESFCFSLTYAWSFGIPTLLSLIEPHLEQSDYFQVKMTYADPKNSDEIAEKIFNILDNYSYEKEIASSNQKIFSTMISNSKLYEELERTFKIQ